MMIKLNFVFEFIWEMVGHITYLLGRDWRKLPMRNETGIHKRQDMW